MKNYKYIKSLDKVKHKKNFLKPKKYKNLKRDKSVELGKRTLIQIQYKFTEELLCITTNHVVSLALKTKITSKLTEIVRLDRNELLDGALQSSKLIQAM